jgi:hypothetical protein
MGTRNTLLMLLVTAIFVVGCSPTGLTWYEQRCERLGFEPRSGEFRDCVARDKAWVEENRRRSREGIGP